MTHETKQLLMRSINVFLESSDKVKEEMVAKVQNVLKVHENALNSIGMGYSENTVQAARIFLRIYKCT